MSGISDGQYEELRQILVRVKERPYTFEDAKEIGDELVAFYTMLWEWNEEEINNE